MSVIFFTEPELQRFASDAPKMLDTCDLYAWTLRAPDGRMCHGHVFVDKRVTAAVRWWDMVAYAMDETAKQFTLPRQTTFEVADYMVITKTQRLTLSRKAWTF